MMQRVLSNDIVTITYRAHEYELASQREQMIERARLEWLHPDPLRRPVHDAFVFQT